MTITVLDGGMGGEIQKRISNSGKGLWSARALIEKPQIVVDLHREYIEAGARMIITNTYSTIPSYLAKENLQTEYVRLTRLAGKLARQAVDAGSDKALVAGSIPPLSESYRPDLVPAKEVALPVYQNMVEALQPFVDLYICETMSSGVEAELAASQAKRWGNGKPVYVSWTLNEAPGSGLRSGESLAEAFNKIAYLDVDGYMLNCTCPEVIESGLIELAELTAKPLGCYANRMGRVPEGWTLDNALETGRRSDVTTDYFVAQSLRAAAAGATIIGGCCGIGPADIKALSRALTALNQ